MDISHYDPATNKTNERLTKYELVKIIGMRAEQLARGARSTLGEDYIATDPVHTATQELRNRKLPFMIRRRLPNGSYELWRLRDMTFSEDALS